MPLPLHSTLTITVSGNTATAVFSEGFPKEEDRAAAREAGDVDAWAAAGGAAATLLGGQCTAELNEEGELVFTKA